MSWFYSDAQQNAAVRRLQSGEPIAAVSADTGISATTLARWLQQADLNTAAAAPDGKMADITGPGISDHWGVTATDLGASVIAPNGKLVSVFGDTFSGNRVGEGKWRSPVVLIGTGDAQHPITWERAGGPNPDFAEQLWFYVHDTTGPRWTQGGISTVLPSDLLRVGDTLYLHVMVNRGFPEVIWTEIWRSDDSGLSWQHMGEKAKFPAALHNGYAQCWSWDYDPDDGWVYVVSTGFKRDRGIILRRVRAGDIGDMSKYSGWGFADGRWAWDNAPPDHSRRRDVGRVVVSQARQGHVDHRRVSVVEVRARLPHHRPTHRQHVHGTDPAARHRVGVEQRRPCGEPSGAALWRLRAARLPPRCRRRRRSGRLAMEDRQRLALPSDAIPLDSEGHRTGPWTRSDGPDQPVAPAALLPQTVTCATWRAYRTKTLT